MRPVLAPFRVQAVIRYLRLRSNAIVKTLLRTLFLPTTNISTITSALGDKGKKSVKPIESPTIKALTKQLKELKLN